MIIDAHAHVFEYYLGMGPRGEGRAVGDGMAHFANGDEMRILPPHIGGRCFTGEMLIEEMDKAEIDKAVLLQGFLYGFQNEYVYECARKYPHRFVAAYTLDPYSTQVQDILRRFDDDFHCRILKFEVSSGAGLSGIHPNFKLDGREMRPIYEFASFRSATIVLDIGSPEMKSYQISELQHVIKEYSNVRFVVCHLLAPNGRGHEQWVEDMRNLSTDNSWFDISALPWNIREDYPYPSGLWYVEKAKQIVGVDRLIWGSDVPLLLNVAPYQKLYSFLDASDDLNEGEREKILSKNAEIAYAIGKEGK
jgi:predicted TIM-barrel fold metal-dependent hydrolase